MIFFNLFSNSPLSAAINPHKLPKVNNSILEELSKVYFAWTKKYHQDPVEFLSEKVNKKATYSQLTHYTELDFTEDNIIVINGLMLGKTEAALLATMYICHKENTPTNLAPNIIYARTPSASR